MVSEKIILEKSFRDLEDVFLRMEQNKNKPIFIIGKEERKIIEKFEELCPSRRTTSNILNFFRLLEDLIKSGFIGVKNENETYEEKNGDN